MHTAMSTSGASQRRMASECEKGTSSSVYRALLSTHPFPQWPHWGWAQVKAYLKGLFNTEKRGRIPKPQGRGGEGWGGVGGFTAGSSPSTPACSLELSPCYADNSLHRLLTLHFCFSSPACLLEFVSHMPSVYMWTCHSLSSPEDRGQRKGRGGRKGWESL